MTTTSTGRLAFVRGLQESEVLPEADRWLAGLPPEIAPRLTAGRFPHIVNCIARLWRSPRQLDRYFDDLLVDRRGGRQGFPYQVAAEIARLRDYYQVTVYPVRACVWQGLPGSGTPSTAPLTQIADHFRS